MPGMTDRDAFAAAALTGLLYPEVDDEFAMSYIVGRAYRWADAMLRERKVPDGTGDTDHGASPEARASVDSVAPQPTTRGESDRNDKAAPQPSEGTGDTPDSPKPIKGGVSDSSKPINGPTPVHTPPAHATRGEGSEQRECTEPVAWAVCTPGDGDWSPCFFHEPHAQRCASAIFGSKNIVPLYRSPTLTDAEREAIYRASQYLSQNDVFEGMAEDAATLRGLLERLGGEG